MSTVLKKGAPSRSYPSRQRKLGPAPFASFEDLSDEMDSPGMGGEENKVNVMPEIKEDRQNERTGETCQSPTQSMPGGGGEEDTPVAVRAHKNVTATSSTSTVTFAPSYSAPTSGPTSGLQTPSTPRIDISCASSSTPPSDESASEKELFQGGLGLAFHEEAVDDLRSSTEELDLGEEEISSEEERRRKRLEEQEMREQDIYRRSSHPANIFSRKASVPAAPPPPSDEDNFQRKPSAHSLFLEGLLNRPCRHASFGHGDYMRPGAVSSLSTHSAGSGYRSRSRSPSPHKMMFETSFCGSKPIPTKSMERDSPPKDSSSSRATASKKPPPLAAPSSSSTSKPPGIQTYYSSHSQPQSTLVSAAGTPTPSSTTRFFDERPSLKSPSKKMVITPSWERHQTELEQVCREVASSVGAAAEGAGPNKDIDSVSRSKTPLSPQPSSLGFDSRRPSTGRRSVSPHKMLLETSFCGNKPIPTRSMEMESPPKDLADLGALLAECNKLAAASGASLVSSRGQVNEHCHKTVTTAQVHRHSSSGDRSSVISKEEEHFPQQQAKPLQRKSDAGQYTLGTEWNSAPFLQGSPESPKSSDLWQPITPSPRMELRSPAAFPATTSPSSLLSQPQTREDACSNSSSVSPQGIPTLTEKIQENSHGPAPSTSPAASTSLTTKYKENSSKSSKEIDRSPSTTPATAKKMFSQHGATGGGGGGGGIVKTVGFQSEKSESSRDHDDDEGEITTEMQIKEDPTVTVEDVPIESKGLFFQSDSFDEEGDLPYVPTTLPQEKSTGVAIIPVSERKKMALMLTTVPVSRPKVNRPAAPASLNDYIEYSKNTLPKNSRGSGESGAGGAGVGGTGCADGDADGGQVVAKMKINLPREDSLTNSSGGKGKGQRKGVSTTTWTDFAHMGLLSPREIRRKMKEENGAVDDVSSYHSDSSSTNDIPGAVDGAEEEAESLLKLPKVPFAMDLDVHSNRSSVISQDEVQKSPSECSALLGSPDEPETTGSKKSDSHD